MRISDWSSDVCSSDLGGGDDEEEGGQQPPQVRVGAHYFTSPSAASTTGASGASLAGPTPTGTPASGWLRSNAGRSLRMRGIDVKLCRGGGDEVAHSSDTPYPQERKRVG